MWTERVLALLSYHRLLLVGIALLAATLTPTMVGAHPMGNFSINQFAHLEVRANAVRVRYRVDMAEIPAFQEMQKHRLTDTSDNAAISAYKQRRIPELMKGLTLSVNDRPLTLKPRDVSVTFPPGAAALPTLRINALFEARMEETNGLLTYEDHNYQNRLGWKEIVANGASGVAVLESNVPQKSRSKGLVDYDQDLLNVPPRDTSARLSFRATSVLAGKFSR